MAYADETGLSCNHLFEKRMITLCGIEFCANADSRTLIVGLKESLPPGQSGYKSSVDVGRVSGKRPVAGYINTALPKIFNAGFYDVKLSPLDESHFSISALTLNARSRPFKLAICVLYTG
jgi:hypothetical protein